ncbi:MAG: nucleoside 2-deoxyribosyltransferase [Syntrophobacteraceae bacterium]|nr:nucleoside 2-deoxyribosyltransferase [Desulfobacteraceae bacterium]
MTIYLAGPLFTEAERAWMLALKNGIIDLAARIGVTVNVLWPWEFISEVELRELRDRAGLEIFRSCVSHLDAADMVIALLDGPMVDDGTAWEIGYFYRLRSGPEKPIIGIRTDLRNAGETPSSIINAMIEHSCDHIARSETDLLGIVEDLFDSFTHLIQS